MRLLLIGLMMVLAACDTVVVQSSAPTLPPPTVDPGPQLSARQATNNFATVVRRVEPVAEQYCRQSGQQNCDFLIVVDDRPGQPVNAYQTLDRTGRPIIGFTASMIVEVRNQDELAFVLAHEAAHHIRGHIVRQQQNAALGAVVLGGLAGGLGSSGAATGDTAQRVGGVGRASWRGRG